MREKSTHDNVYNVKTLIKYTRKGKSNTNIIQIT